MPSWLLILLGVLGWLAGMLILAALASWRRSIRRDSFPPAPPRKRRRK